MDTMNQLMTPATISELLDRLEAAESARRDDYQNWMTALDRNAELLAKLEAAEKTNREWLRANAPEGWIDNLRIENEALRAKIKAMERQEPVAWLHETRRDSDVVTDAVKHVWGKAVVGALAAYSIPLYLAHGAQPAPSIPDDVMREFVMDAIAQALGDAYDCTRVWSAWGYGTMSQDDFHLIAEDSDRLREIADAAIMAMGAAAQWGYVPAPSVPDGWKLVPIEPTPGMIDAAEYVDWGDADVRGSCINAWNRMLSVAPEAKT